MTTENAPNSETPSKASEVSLETKTFEAPTVEITNSVDNATTEDDEDDDLPF